MKSRYSERYKQKITYASPFALAWYRLLRRKGSVAALIVVGLFFVFALLSFINFFGITDKAAALPEDIGASRYKPFFSSLDQPFGSDGFGRNAFLRAIVSTKISMLLGIFTGLLSLPISVVIGALAGYYGKWLDMIAIYLMSVIVAIPGLLVILSLIRILGPSYITISLTFAITGWVGLARVLRGNVLQLRETEFVLAAKNLGASDARIIITHIIPNLANFMLVNLILTFVSVIRSEVFLAYVGLTVIGIPTWGTMISDARNDVIVGNWQSLGSAAIFMFIFLLSLNVLGDTLSDVLDPRQKNR